MKNWLRQKLHNFLYPSDRADVPKSNLVARSNDVDIDGLRFNIMVAEGGTIMQVRSYNQRTDQSTTKTYVIPDDEQDVAHRVGQIVAMEMIKL